MIPASAPHVVSGPAGAITYDGWAVTLVSISRTASGVASARVRLTRCREIVPATGATELAPETPSVWVSIDDLYAPVGALGPWWAGATRAAVLTAVGAVEAAAGAVGSARGLT